MQIAFQRQAEKTDNASPSDEAPYLIVGNFTSEYNDMLHKGYNRGTGLSDLDFQALMMNFAMDHNALFSNLGQIVVIKGNESLAEQLTRDCGDRFSRLVFSGREELDEFLRDHFDPEGDTPGGVISLKDTPEYLM